MCIRKIVFISSIGCLLLNLNSCKSKGRSSNQLQIMMNDDSQTTVEWIGTYSRIVPCTGCEGIETQIILNTDSTYQISLKYSNKNEQKFKSSGTFQWNAQTNIIILGNLDETQSSTQYLIVENKLHQLDINGNRITGDLSKESYS